MAKDSVRYGAEIRKLARAVDKQKRTRYACPKCGKKKVKRVGNSLWVCISCDARFAGGAYSLSTGIGETAGRIIADARSGRKVKG